jgi:type I restriction enzyme S subunit
LDKKELFILKLKNLSEQEKIKLYDNTNDEEIINENETVIQDYNKKLTNKYNIDKEYIKMEQTMNNNIVISNKEALKDKIHEIHNYLRNNGAGYGMNALKVFNIFYGLKKIEDKNLIDKLELKKPDCVFSHLVELAINNEDEQIATLIYGSILDTLAGSNIRDLLFYEIPRNIKGSSFTYLIKEINKITEIENKCNVLLSGKIYEYFIGRDDSAISELGAYFTDRHITDFIYNKLQPTMINNNIKTMCDMFGGSGGFTTGYIDYLNKKYPNQINWNTELNKVHHFDMNEDVIKSAGLEFFCLTGVMPNMKNNLCYKNSFADSFGDRKFELIVTNPPYGGDKNKQSDSQIKRDKVKKYIKEILKTLYNENKDNEDNKNTENTEHNETNNTNDEINNNDDNEEEIKIILKQLKSIEKMERKEKKELDKQTVSLKSCSTRINNIAVVNGNIEATDKEACSLLLMMDMLDVNGTCIGVLKEGVFFNKTYSDIRKLLINKYNITEIISIPQDQFENTSTKTSIVIFDNKTITTEIKFSELIVEKFENDKIEKINGIYVLTENKGDIKNVIDKLIVKVKLEDLNNNKNYSLYYKDYNKKEIVCGEGYELKKLGDLCDFLPKSKKKASYGKLEGKYNFYTSSDKIKKCDEYDYDEECILIGTGGNSCIHYNNTKFSCSADILLLKSKTTINIKTIYQIILSMWNILKDCMHGSTIKHITKETLINFNIPVLKNNEQTNLISDELTTSYNEKNNKEKKLIELELEISNKIEEINNNEECEEIELGNLCKILKGTKHCTNISKDVGKYKFYNSSQTDELYVDFVEITEWSIIIGQGGNISIHFDKDFTPSKHVCVLQSNNNNYEELRYIYEYLKVNLNKFITKGSVIQWLNKQNIKKVKILVPKDKNIFQNVKQIFEIYDKTKLEIIDTKKIYNDKINELTKKSIVNIK